MRRAEGAADALPVLQPPTYTWSGWKDKSKGRLETHRRLRGPPGVIYPTAHLLSGPRPVRLPSPGDRLVDTARHGNKINIIFNCIHPTCPSQTHTAVLSLRLGALELLRLPPGHLLSLHVVVLRLALHVRHGGHQVLQEVKLLLKLYALLPAKADHS